MFSLVRVAAQTASFYVSQHFGTTSVPLASQPNTSPRQPVHRLYQSMPTILLCNLSPSSPPSWLRATPCSTWYDPKLQTQAEEMSLSPTLLKVTKQGEASVHLKFFSPLSSLTPFFCIVIDLHFTRRLSFGYEFFLIFSNLSLFQPKTLHSGHGNA